ncbi:MAG TPA: RDD family protein [Burkholderiaceae bacterium]
MNTSTLSYAGFWRRFGAALIDSIVVALALSAALWLLTALGILQPSAAGASDAEQLAQLLSILNSSSPPEAKLQALSAMLSAGGGDSGSLSTSAQLAIGAVFCIAFWLARQATPGKIVVAARVVDAKTLGPLKSGQAIIRYLGYFVSGIPLFLGFLWVAFDPRKQGWHDKLAGTLVLHDTEAVSNRPEQQA